MASSSGGPGRCYTSRCTLPFAWETRVTGMRNQNALTLVKVDGLKIKYIGPGEDDSQAVTVRANYPLPVDCPLYYFEITVLDKGAEGFIGVGFQTDEVLLSRLPGWEPHSYGYHGDDGCSFSGSGSGRPFGPKFEAGDVVGALYNRADQTISYFKNGAPLGVAFSGVAEPSPLYPCVGMRTRGEEVVANFGGSPFTTDFAALQDAYRARSFSSIAATPLPLLCGRGTALLPQLLYDHLMHQRCWRTAALLGQDLLRADGQLGERELADITQRQAAYELVVQGKIDEALAVVAQAFPPEVLSSRPDLELRLRVQKFVEMVASACSTPSTPHKHAASGTPSASPAPLAADVGAVMQAALQYGRSEVAPRCRTPADQELLQDALSLLAYEQPEASPAGYLLKRPHKVALAEELNGAILACRGLPATSPLERLYQQAAVTMAELKRLDDPRVIVLPDVRKMVLEGPALGGGAGGTGSSAAGPGPSGA